MNSIAKISSQNSNPPEHQNIPTLLDAHGVRKHIAPIGRTLLYQLASTGEIETVSLGMGKRGKRLYLAASILDFIRRRAEITQRPKMGCKKGSQPGAVSDGSECHQEAETPSVTSRGFRAHRTPLPLDYWLQKEGTAV